jgi:aquaporin Z
MIHLDAAGAFLAEVILTFLFVFIVLAVTRKAAWPQLGGVAIGLALTTVHLIGIPLTGTSVNPARSLGPALFVGGAALSQLWLFLLAPLVGGALAALAAVYFYPGDHLAPDTTAAATLAAADARPDLLGALPASTPTTTTRWRGQMWPHRRRAAPRLRTLSAAHELRAHNYEVCAGS